MHYANFNITFGEREEPMLKYFENIIYPAFTSDLKRGKEGEYPIFGFSDVKIKKILNGDYVLVGNYIKETTYNRHTEILNGKLKESPLKVPTAPYSRFIIFLKNHRMILVRNESISPDIRSFQATVRKIISQYISKKNRENKKEYLRLLPYAIVNIVDIPLREDIETIFKDISKINWVQLRFFPLNNDLDQHPLAKDVRNQMKIVGSNTANMKFNTPDSKQGVKDMVEQSSGLAATTMFVSNKNGETRRIKEESFSSNRKIPFSRDINEGDDEDIISIANKDDVINKVSKSNESLYKKFIVKFQKFIL